MDILEIGKGVLCVIGGIIYFKFFNKPYLDKETEDKWREMGTFEQMIEGSKFDSKLQFVMGFIAGISLFIFGLLFIYNELARNFGWALLFVDK